MKDTQITATFKSRGNQEDMLFMTPAATVRSLDPFRLVCVRAFARVSNGHPLASGGPAVTPPFPVD